MRQDSSYLENSFNDRAILIRSLDRQSSFANNESFRSTGSNFKPFELNEAIDEEPVVPLIKFPSYIIECELFSMSRDRSKI